MLQKYARPFTHLNDSQLCSGRFSSKGLQASWGHIKQHGPPGWKHTENTNQTETLMHLDVNKMCCFSHIRNSLILLTLTGQAVPQFDRVLRDVIRWLFPEMQQRAQTPKWLRSAAFMIAFDTIWPSCSVLLPWDVWGNARDDLLSCFIFGAWYNRHCENSSLCSLKLL